MRLVDPLCAPRHRASARRPNRLPMQRAPRRAALHLELLEDRCLLATGIIQGQIFNDLNGDGQRQPGEPGLNGVTIQLLDAQGNLVATTVTADRDLNGNGSIDPQTERGLYQFTGLALGSYT